MPRWNRFYSPAKVAADQLRGLAADMEKGGGEVSFDLKVHWRNNATGRKLTEEIGAHPIVDKMDEEGRP